MTKKFTKTRLVVFCLLFSLLVHVLLLYALKMFGTYDFAAPVNPLQGAVVDLTKNGESAAPAVNPDDRQSDATEDDAAGDDDAPTRDEDAAPPPELPEQRTPVAKTAVPPADGAEKKASAADASRQRATTDLAISALRMADEFMKTKNEKLTYQVSMFGFPVGSAELEAKNENGEILITLRVASNFAISSVFPVNNVVETRHIAGKFIMAQIKQQEGSYRSDEQFTINLLKKRVTWLNRINGHGQTTAVPTDEVLDTVSGIYYLRNRQLEVGRNEILHIFDSETYSDVPVEILRRETMRLPNLTEVKTLVIRPLQMTAGIFRRTGDILIWLTDDEFKVPVKIVTSIALGTVTAELVSAVTVPLEEDAKKQTPHEPQK